MKKTTKAVLSSAISIALCASLIAGSTFALFTSEDSVNVAVTSGKVDLEATVTGVEAYSAKWESEQNDYVDDPITPSSMSGEFTNGGTYAYNTEEKTLTLDRVSPGDGVKLTLSITNKSSIKTKYRFQVSTVEDNGLLAGLETAYTFTTVGEAGKEIEFTDYDTYRFSAWTELEAAADGESEVGTAEVKVELPITAGNKYNSNCGTGFTCKLNVSVYAVQANANVIDYLAWDGVSKATDEEIAEAIDEETNTLNVEKPAVLASLAEKVNDGTANDYKDYEWKLGASMDLSAAEEDWTPVGTREHPFEGTFNGNGNVLKGIEVSEEQTYDGVFGYTKGATISDVTISGGEFHGKPDSGSSLSTHTGVVAGYMENSTIKDVTVDGVKVEGAGYVSLLVGEAHTGTIEGCTVRNSELTANTVYAGGIAGQGYASLKNCTVENCQITGKQGKTAGVIGQWNEGAYTMSGITVKNVTLRINTYSDYGMIVGFANYGNKSFEDCNVIDCTVENVETGAFDRLTCFGGFIGSYETKNAAEANLSFKNCHVENLHLKSQAGFGPYVGQGVGGFVGDRYSNSSIDTTSKHTTTFTFEDCSVSLLISINEGKDPNALGAFIGSFKGAENSLGNQVVICKFIGNNNSYSGCDNVIGVYNRNHITVEGDVTKK